MMKHKQSRNPTGKISKLPKNKWYVEKRTIELCSSNKQWLQTLEILETR